MFATDIACLPVINITLMNILKVADGITGLFPRKIAVAFVHAVTGEMVAARKVSPESLPEAFNRPTVMEIEGQLWRVVKADPVHISNLRRHRELVLHVQEASHFRASRSLVPTRAALLPAVVALPAAHDSTLSITPDEWRQLEFLPTHLQPVVEEEMRLIEAVILSTPDEDALLGYDAVHIREKTGTTPLRIPFDDLYLLVNGKEKGAVRLDDNAVIADSFFIRSENYMYYGVCEGEDIVQLCLQEFDSADDEFSRVVMEWDLLLADWCGGRVM